VSRRNRTLERRNGDAPYKMVAGLCEVQVQKMTPDGKVWVGTQCQQRATRGQMCQEHHASHSATWGSVTKESS
jgi:hypothetical protein